MTDDVAAQATPYAMAVRMIERLADRVRRRAAEMGYDYPVGYFLICALFQVGSLILGAGQRVAAGVPWIAVVACAIWALQFID